MMRSFLFICCLFGLTATVQGQPSGQVEQVFSGEGNCKGLSANIDVTNAAVEVNKDAIISVVAESIIEASESGQAAQATAVSIGRRILEVTAEALAKVKAEVNSPNPGCWAVAYGQAQAIALARAVVDAIAEGFAVALAPNAAAAALAVVETREEDVQKAVESVAILLAKGDGSGFNSDLGSATATAKATAINCAMAEAYATIYSSNNVVAEAIVQAGCPPETGRTAVGQADLEIPCQCRTDRALGGCGVQGGADEICYVSDPSRCTCAQDSVVHSGQMWRFCGTTLKTMKKLLDFEDKINEIQRTEQGFGYCPSLKA